MRPKGTPSTALCQEAMAALDRIFALESPDEPDLGHNVTYATARQWLIRFSRAEPWQVPASRAATVRDLIANVWATSDPIELEAQLDEFAPLVVSAIDRRSGGRDASHIRRMRRRAGDRLRRVLTSAGSRRGRPAWIGGASRPAAPRRPIRAF